MLKGLMPHAGLQLQPPQGLSPRSSHPPSAEKLPAREPVCKLGPQTAAGAKSSFLQISHSYRGLKCGCFSPGLLGRDVCLELGLTLRWSHCGEKWGTTARKIGVFHAPPKERIYILQAAFKCYQNCPAWGKRCSIPHLFEQLHSINPLLSSTEPPFPL